MNGIEITNHFNTYILDIILGRQFDKIEYRKRVGIGPAKTRLYIYPNDSNSHHRPHVHVKHPDGDFVVSLDDFTLLAGKMKTSIKKAFLEYFEKNKDKFIDIWKELNSSNN